MLSRSSWWNRRRGGNLCLALLLAAGGVAARGAALACTGDCNDDGQVTVDELLKGVNIALGTVPASDCVAMDVDHNGMVTVDELLAAVNAALNGCPTPTVTATASPTVTATPTPNLPPVVTAPDIYRTYPGFDIHLPIVASDPEGGALQFAAAALPVNAELDPVSGVLSWTPTGDQVGAYTIPVSVMDSGDPPAVTSVNVPIQVTPLDACVSPNCDPATGCQSTLVDVNTMCCSAPPTVRVGEPPADCPQAAVLAIGRNAVGFGKIENCDQLRVTNNGQIGAVLRFNLEARCVRIDAPATVHVQMETKDRLVFDTDLVVNLTAGDDGYAVRQALQVTVIGPGPFLNLEGAEANFNVTLTDGDGVVVSHSVRPVLTFSQLDDLPETP